MLLVGLPGSGKSTWARSKAKPGKSGVLSSDSIRELLADDANNQAIHARVFGVLRDLLKQRLELKRPVTYVDATNLTPYERRPYIEVALLYDADIEAVFFDVPTSECIRRNRGREREVPGEVIRKMAERLVPPGKDEGFLRITRPTSMLQE